MTKITISNRNNSAFEVSGKKPLLNELRDQGVDLPYGCQYGGCITCAAKLINGEVDQRSQVALNNRQINDGYIILLSVTGLTGKTLYPVFLKYFIIILEVFFESGLAPTIAIVL